MQARSGLRVSISASALEGEATSLRCMRSARPLPRASSPIIRNVCLSKNLLGFYFRAWGLLSLGFC